MIWEKHVQLVGLSEAGYLSSAPTGAAAQSHLGGAEATSLPRLRPRWEQTSLGPR